MRKTARFHTAAGLTHMRLPLNLVFELDYANVLSSFQSLKLMETK